MKVYILVSTLVALVICDDIQERAGYCRMQDVYIREGETKPGPIGRCINVRCLNATPGQVMMSGLACATFQPRPGCRIGPYDNTKRYPDCCPGEICDDVDNNHV